MARQSCAAVDDEAAPCYITGPGAAKKENTVSHFLWGCQSAKRHCFLNEFLQT